MKTMNNFAAQQLSKNQMNEVMGGAKVSCDLIVNGEIYDLGTQVTEMFYLDVQAKLQTTYDGVGEISCQPWLL